MPSVLLPENAISIIRGSSKTYELVVTNEGTGQPVDLTDARVIFTVKSDIDDDHALFQKDSAWRDPQDPTNLDKREVVIVEPGRKGIARIFITPRDTVDLEPREYAFDVWVILNQGSPQEKHYPVIEPSIFNVQRGVTLVPVL